jgi:hypothetical protein
LRSMKICRLGPATLQSERDTYSEYTVHLFNIYLTTYLPDYLCICLSACPCICLSVRPFTYLYLCIYLYISLCVTYWLLLFVVYLTTLFQCLRLYSVDFYSILIRLPSSSEAGETRVRNMAAEFCLRVPIVLVGFFNMP